MKRSMIAALVMIGIIGLLTLNGYGAEPMTALPKEGADPIVSNIREGDSSHTAAGMGGFAEFGFASLLGFIFVFAVAAYEIGATPPPMETEEKSFEKKRPLTEAEWKERWAAAA